MDLGERINSLLHKGYSVTFRPYLKDIYGDEFFEVVVRKDDFNISRRYYYNSLPSECPSAGLDLILKFIEEIFEAKEKDERNCL